MIIRDSIQNDILIDEPVVKAVIFTYEFQRLRKIKQLGLSSIIFPSADHARYSHSIGVYNLAKRYIEAIEKNANIQFLEDEKLSLILAALLHDIGHGPLSHTSEDFFDFSHEDYSIGIIEGDTEVNSVLKEYCPNLIDQIVQFINKEHPNKVLNSILSGTIDIDRMDYLYRDSQHAGVTYGQFDFNRLLKLVDVVDGELVYWQKGVHTIEDFIMGRYHMFTQIYLNKKVIYYEVLAKEILLRVKELLNADVKLKTDVSLLLPFFEKGKVSVKDYVLMNDYVLLNMFDSFSRIEEDKKLRALSKNFVLLKIKNKRTCESDIEFNTDSISKKIYNENVRIKTKNDVVNLDEVSDLIKFMKEELRISQEGTSFYIENYEK